MADVKWIKIVTDIFDDEKMLLIDGMPEHDSIIVIWFKLLCLAGKQNNGGVIMISDRIAYTDEMLATIFHRPLNSVRLALEVFEKFGMIEIVDDAITIPNWNKHQSLDGYERKKLMDRERIAKKRAEQKAVAALSQNVGDSRVTESEEEIDKEEESIDTTSSPAAREKSCPFAQIQELYLSICVSYPTIKRIDGTRKTAVAARWRTYHSLDTFRELFRLAESSPFLKGENDRNWSADFDWMMKPTNFAKILEHKYDDHTRTTGSLDLQDAQRRAIEETPVFKKGEAK